jgi:AcrR family transcriptional regulator
MAEHTYHHGALRRALLDAALATLDEGEEISLRAVARRAGVSHAAPYHHFADRKALVAALAQEGLARLMDALRAAALPEEDPRLQLLEIGVVYVRFATENRALFRLMFSAELADREGLPELQSAYAEAYEVLAGRVRVLLGGSATPEEVREWALWARSLVHGLASLLLDNQVAGVQTPEQAEALARAVLRKSLQ